MERAEGIDPVFLPPVEGGSTWKVDLLLRRKPQNTNKGANLLRRKPLEQDNKLICY